MSDPYTDWMTLSGDWEGYEPGREDAPFGSLPEQPPVTLDSIAALMEHPLPPRRTLHCHPTVTVALKMTGAPADPAPSFMLGRVGDLVAIDVFENDEMMPGAWEIREGEEVVNFGVLRDCSEEAR